MKIFKEIKKESIEYDDLNMRIRKVVDVLEKLEFENFEKDKFIFINDDIVGTYFYNIEDSFDRTVHLYYDANIKKVFINAQKYNYCKSFSGNKYVVGIEYMFKILFNEFVGKTDEEEMNEDFNFLEGDDE